MLVQLAFALYPLVLTGIAVAWLLTGPAGRISPRVIDFASALAVIVFAIVAGSWVFTSLYLRHVAAGLFVVAAVLSLRRAPRTFGRSRAAWRTNASLAAFIAFAVLDVLAIASHFAPRGATDVAFPLGAGTYAVMQGGDSRVTNPFHAMSGNGLALDVVRLNAYGNRAAGLAPRALEDYAIFGDGVLSPCAGNVASTRNDVPDNPPGNPDRQATSGNFVIVHCAGVEILLAHFRRGSIVVAAGEAVGLRQPLGQVGNSGYTLEPHLHIGATRDGVASALTFDGRALSVNSTVNSMRVPLAAGQREAEATGRPRSG